MGYLAMRQKVQARKSVEAAPVEFYDEEHEDGGEPDLHQCGHCKLMFNNLTKYITHKLQKVCWTENVSTEDATWSPEQNGSSSPEVSAKEDMDEDAVRSNVEVKNLHQELQKRKHRKGLVRRLKPPDIPEENMNIESLAKVYIPDEEGTLFLQEVQQGENHKESGNIQAFKGTEILHIASSEDTVMTGDESTKDMTHKDKSMHPESPAMYSLPNKSAEPIDKTFLSPSAYSLSQNVCQISSPSTARDHPHLKQYYSQSNSSNKRSSKFDRVPSNLPQVMSTHGFSGSYDHSQHRDRLYLPINDIDQHNKQKYHSYYETDTSSTWTTQYWDKPSVSYTKTERQSKYDYPPYDKYRTMANLDGNSGKSLSDVPSFISRSDPQMHTVESLNKEEKKVVIVDEKSNASVDMSAEPPELVRVLSNGEKVNLDMLSPPSLEKCDTLEYMQPKMEEEGSRDSLQESMDVPAEEKTLVSEKTDDLQEQDLSSPEKESNSPVDSIHSHDTEDFNPDQSNRDVSETHLPRHRRLSESTVERLITEPSTQGADASWKHAKQVYRCPLCAKIFPFKSKLQRHVLVHTGIKPYKCTVCGRGFTQQIDLQRHLTRHTGEKPFKCHLCKAQFIRADNLRKHCKDAHYVNIEEPIRKRRRKTTGSDTVLPPLEVAIALALSETERNGGRVLGRAVTKSNTKATTSRARQEQRRPEEGNTITYGQPLPSHPDAPPYQGNYPPHLVPRHDLRYPFQPGMESNQPYSLQRRPGSPLLEHSTSPTNKGVEGRPVYPPGEGSRYYKSEPPPSGAAYYGHIGYEREPSEFHFQDRERAARRGDPRVPPEHRFADPRYQINYRSMGIDPRTPGYISRRPAGEHVVRRMPNDFEYLNRRPTEVRRISKRPNEIEEFLDRRSVIESDYAAKYTGSPRDGDIVQPRSEREDITVYRREDSFDARATFLNRYTVTAQQQQEAANQQSKSGRFILPPVDRDNHHAVFLDKPSINYGDDSQAGTARSPNRQKQGRNERQDFRDHYDTFEGRSMVTKNNKSAVDPGEYVSMATDRNNHFSTSPSLEMRQGEDSPVVAPINVYVDEQEIPIVTPSDDLTIATKGVV